MTPTCADCGGQCVYVRHHFEVVYPAGRLIAEEVPSVRCEACGRTDPAAHVRPDLDAVLELVQEVPAVARKSFTRLPLRPDDEAS